MGIRRAQAKIVELLDGEPILEVHVGTDELNSFNNIYRVEWDSVYGENEKEYDLKQYTPLNFGTLSPSQSVEFVLPEKVKSLEVTCSPKNYGYQLNVSVTVEGITNQDQLFLELKGESETKYFSTNGMVGTQCIVRAEGLKPDVYTLGFVLQQADGIVKYE